MGSSFNWTVSPTRNDYSSYMLNGIKEPAVLYTLVLVISSAILLTRCDHGVKVLQLIVQFIDGMLGGASHKITIPGPAGLPLVGNLMDLKSSHIQKISQWSKQYGDVVRVSLGERETVFINSHQALAQTVVQHGPAYQSRPTFKLFHSDYASSGIWTVDTSPYSSSLARTRKAFSSQTAARILPTYNSVIYPKLKNLFEQLLDVSQGPALDLAEKLHCFGTGQIAEQLMGQVLDDETVKVIAENETNIFRQRTVGSPLRDYIPFLRTVGSVRYTVMKLFGMSKWAVDHEAHNALEYRRKQQVYVDKMLEDLKVRLAAGSQTPSIMGNLLRQGSLNDEEILLACYTGIAAGINLGYSLIWIVGYLANRSDLQQKGFEAIQEIYNGEPPKPYEYDRVEYVKALHTEGSRLFTPVRLGFPRETLDGASYNGHAIPKGTLVIMNLFQANRDPVAFNKPDEFLPERWLGGYKGRTDLLGEGGAKLGTPHLTYGAGRRVCPGIDVANRGLYSTLVLLLHFFTWERQSLGEEKRKLVFLPFRAQRECSLEMDAIRDTATPTEAQAIPWSVGIKFHCRNPEALRSWLDSPEH